MMLKTSSIDIAVHSAALRIAKIQRRESYTEANGWEKLLLPITDPNINPNSYL